MATVNPVVTFLSTYAGKGPVAQSTFITFSFCNTAGYDAWLPVKILSPATANISAGAEVSYFRSNDGGVSFETERTVGLVFDRPGLSATQLRDLTLVEPGMYLIAVMVGGGSAATWSVDFGATIPLITSYA